MNAFGLGKENVCLIDGPVFGAATYILSLRLLIGVLSKMFKPFSGWLC